MTKFLISWILLIFSFRLMACAIVSREKEVGLTRESTVIVWDAEKKTEHFIRRVAFGNDGARFGFIVPVPSIAEVSDFAADPHYHFQREMEKQRPMRKEYEFSLLPSKMRGSIGASLTFPGHVQIAAEYKLNSYDVKVLRPDGLGPLLEWLKENNFDSRPAVEEFLSYYIQKNWYFVVFNFRGNESRQNSETDFVKLSFQTDAPVYPYMEPEDASSEASRELKLYLISDAPFYPDFLTTGAPAPSGWGKDPDFSNVINPGPEISQLAPGLTQPWLTAWTDRTMVRPGRDITFLRTDKNPILPSPWVHEVNVDILTVCILYILPSAFFTGVFFFFRKRTRSAKIKALVWISLILCLGLIWMTFFSTYFEM